VEQIGSTATGSLSTDSAVGGRDDRILPATRWASLAVFLILVPAVIVLWGAPGETADLWSWTIAPDLTPIFLGSGYGAGAYFFWRTFRAEHWHPSSAGVLGASVFAALMLIATLIHWDKFNHGDAPFLAAVAFYGWVGVYIVSPFVVFWLWRRNQQTDPGLPEPGEAIVPANVRLAAKLFAAGALAAAAVFFVSPQTAIDVWPWELTPLTARVLASFTAQVGVGALMLSRDARWSAWRLLVQTFFVATALLLVGALRGFGDFDQGNPLTWLYLGGLLGTDLALVLLYRSMTRRP
jgi:hypothetical protein